MLNSLESTKQGLTYDEAKKRLALYGANRLKPQKRSDTLTLLISQFKSPIILVLFCAIGLSFFQHDPVNAFIILAIVLISGLLGFWQERRALQTQWKSCFQLCGLKTGVLRDGSTVGINNG
jgi:Mg2+-importing ATPase